jgi:hypothetical protein
VNYRLIGIIPKTTRGRMFTFLLHAQNNVSGSSALWFTLSVFIFLNFFFSPKNSIHVPRSRRLLEYIGIFAICVIGCVNETHILNIRLYSANRHITYRSKNIRPICIRLTKKVSDKLVIGIIMPDKKLDSMPLYTANHCNC